MVRYLASLPAIFLILIAASPAERSISHNRVYRNSEYAIRLEVPARYEVCVSRSGSHPFGFYYNLGGGSCRLNTKSSPVSTVGLYGSYATMGKSSPSDSFPDDCHRRAPSPKIAFGKLSISGHPTQRCAVQHEDGSIDIYLVTQVPDRSASDTLRPPSVSYVAFLSTRAGKLETDLLEFKKLLSTAKIGRVRP